MLQQPALTPRSRFSSLASNKKIWLLLLITAMTIIAIIFFIVPRILSLYYSHSGYTFLNQGQYSKAITNYTNAIQLDSCNELAYYNRGIAYEGIGQYPQVIADETTAINLDSRDEHAYDARGFSYN